MVYNEPFRPRLHFTPPSGWLNDPNGLVFYEGEYHIFYQHYAADVVWGPMHWGHAVSTDLINWTHLPIALAPDDLGYIFSGSALVDWHNSAGFGTEALVALFTHHLPQTHQQSQSLAYSLDRGRAWTKHAGNPVIATPANLHDFRDPKVFWYADDDGGGHWVMALATTTAVLFYTSPDLIAWQPSGSFGDGSGASGGVWETPDLFQLQRPDGSGSRWVLLVGVGDGAPAGGSGEQYFIGDFDGQTFHNDNPQEVILWADCGADNYATQSWSDVQDGRRLALSWMNNWTYAAHIPTGPWRGALTLPRELRLIDTPEGTRLAQAPARELQEQRRDRESHAPFTVPAHETVTVPANAPLLELEMTVTLPTPAGDEFGLRLRTGAQEFTTIGYKPRSKTLYIDRRHSGLVDFHEAFPARHSAPLTPRDSLLRLHLIMDESSIELFADEGAVVFTEQIFPTGEALQVELFAGETAVTIQQLELYGLQPAAFYKQP
jgi:fructan beta-fructosidase